MRVSLLTGILAGLLLATGATALALGENTKPVTPGVQPASLSPNAVESGLRPTNDLAARPAAQSGLAIINGLAVVDPDPTCGVPFTVHVNVANQTNLDTLPGTVSLQNIHRGTGTVNYTGSQSYPSIPPGGNYVVVFQVSMDRYISRGQQLTASTNGNTFSLKYDIRQGDCSKSDGSVPAPPEGTGQFLQVQHSGKCLDVPGGSRNSVTPVQQYSCTGNENQAWALESVGNGYFRIVSRFSGMCLDVQGFSQQAHALVQQYPCNGGDNQSFVFRHASGGYNLIVAKHSGLCLDVVGATNEDKALIQQYPCHGNSNQQWRVR